ncbi:MAG: YggT family protein [Candidatus Acetothermia bacterium]|nr:YggT family protein [Candidatus Acetothermia bacterium]MDH7505056.1 YggT family protein [Candidatus Acetothermia bacterium]
MAGEFFYALARVLDTAINALYVLTIARAIVSWFQPNPRNPLVRLLYLTTEPFLCPIRRLLLRYVPPTEFDFSPLVLILLLIVIQRFLITWLYRLALRI